MKIKIHELLSLPLAALLLSTAFAAEPEWKEVTDAGQLFGLGEYAADWDAQTQTLRLYTDERGTLNEFRTIEHVLEQPQPTLLERDAYFLLPRDGKYAIFSRDGEQLTAYRYNGVEFYGDVAVGTFSPDDMTLWDADLIDLKTKKVIASSGAGEPIGVSPDERSFTVGDTVYDADGNILFQTEVGNIVSPEVRETCCGLAAAMGRTRFTMIIPVSAGNMMTFSRMISATRSCLRRRRTGQKRLWIRTAGKSRKPQAISCCSRPALPQ